MERKRKSVLLTKEEHKAFLKLYRSFPTKMDAEDHFGLIRQVLDLVALKGSGRYDTIGLIRERLVEAAARS